MKFIYLILFISIIIINTDKSLSNDYYCRIDSLFNIRFNLDSSKLITSKQINKYNTQKLLSSDLSQSYITNTQKWGIRRKREYSYNLDSQLTQTISYEWNDSLMDLEYYLKDTSKFNNNKQIELQRGYFWNRSWNNTYEKEYIYNQNSQITEYIYRYWDPDSVRYITYNKIIYTYNNKNQLIEEKIQAFDNLYMIWNDITTKLYAYYADGKKSQTNMAEWDSTSKKWRSTKRINYEYNAKNNLERETTQYWSSSFNSFLDDSKKETSYLSNDLINEEIVSIWDKVNNVWVNSSQNSYSYSNDSCLIYFDQYSDWNSNTKKYNTHFQIEYYNSSPKSKIENELIIQNNRIYPNPTSKFIEFDIDINFENEIEIYSNNGQFINKVRIENNRLDISNLINGVYFIKLNNDIFKFVKE